MNSLTSLDLGASRQLSHKSVQALIAFALLTYTSELNILKNSPF